MKASQAFLSEILWLCNVWSQRILTVPGGVCSRTPDQMFCFRRQSCKKTGNHGVVVDVVVVDVMPRLEMRMDDSFVGLRMLIECPRLVQARATDAKYMSSQI